MTKSEHDRARRELASPGAQRNPMGGERFVLIEKKPPARPVPAKLSAEPIVSSR